MRIVTYNIQWGKGRDGRIDLGRIAETVRGADVIALQEVERHWRPQAFPDQAERLGHLLAGYDWVFGPAVDLASPVPGKRRQLGNMTLSRFPIASARNLPLPSRMFEGHVNDTQALLEAVIDRPAGARVYNFHLNYLSPTLRLAQLDVALGFISDAPAQGGAITMPGRKELGPEDEWIVLPDGRLPPMPRPSVLLGDFNCGPESAEYGAILRSAGHADALALSGFSHEDGVTFPGGGIEPPQRLDHIFMSAELIPYLRRAWIDTDAAGSDHQPVWAEIDL